MYFEFVGYIALHRSRRSSDEQKRKSGNRDHQHRDDLYRYSCHVSMHRVLEAERH